MPGSSSTASTSTRRHEAGHRAGPAAGPHRVHRTGRDLDRRADGDREALRILLNARQDLTVASTAQTNRLRALLLCGDDTDRRAARGALTAAALTMLAQRDAPAGAGRDHAVRLGEIRRLALAVQQARLELAANRKQLLAIVEDIAPGVTDRYGVGPLSAAQAVVRFSHPGRCRSGAAFAALSSTSPVPASSGRTIRHRLNRGGDLALNRAIHAIALTRMHRCSRTRAYDARPRARAHARSVGASSATSPGSFTANSPGR